ncbi:phage tail sheath family protein, partial [Streptomyces fradiae]|uniref:phage tail sheath family protein n=1 Tax=Streptomyces fradiae TaxID=1906 RepID=UPI003698A0EC
ARGGRPSPRARPQTPVVAVCAVPGLWSGTVESALVTHCEQLGDRFAVLDPRDGLDIEGVLAFREPFDTRYAALYHPWLVVRDPATLRDVEVPPSGHLAGIYARVDVERGVHKAPANVVVRGIRQTDGFAQDITRRHQDLLNPRGVNALRFFPGLGHRVWGARTLSSDSSWKYVNVRRLFLYLEESIDEGTQWVVFEPNDESLWALVRQTVGNFLTTVWRSGALAGTTADEAFFVACDRTTMTEDDLANGRLVCVVGVAPVHPAEFVIFRIQQKTRETQIS